MKIGYARVSTGEQHLDYQIEALERAGCEHIFTDKLSGASSARPGLADALSRLGPGDTLIVWRLDRLARSLRHLLDLAQEIATRKAGLHSLSEALETSSATGRLMLHVLAALTEFERDLISERTRAALATARASGKRLGRGRRLTSRQVRTASRAHRSGRTVDELADELGVSRSTLYRNIRELESA